MGIVLELGSVSIENCRTYMQTVIKLEIAGILSLFCIRVSFYFVRKQVHLVYYFLLLKEEADSDNL